MVHACELQVGDFPHRWAVTLVTAICDLGRRVRHPHPHKMSIDEQGRVSEPTRGVREDESARRIRAGKGRGSGGYRLGIAVHHKEDEKCKPERHLLLGGASAIL